MKKKMVLVHPCPKCGSTYLELHARQPEMERLYLDGKILPGELQALVMVSNCLEREFIHRQLATGRPLHLNI